MNCNRSLFIQIETLPQHTPQVGWVFGFLMQNNQWEIIEDQLPPKSPIKLKHNSVLGPISLALVQYVSTGNVPSITSVPEKCVLLQLFLASQLRTEQLQECLGILHPSENNTKKTLWHQNLKTLYIKFWCMATVLEHSEVKEPHVQCKYPFWIEKKLAILVSSLLQLPAPPVSHSIVKFYSMDPTRFFWKQNTQPPSS
jgi:hypothetical protein